MENSGSFLRLLFGTLIYVLLGSLETLIFIGHWPDIVAWTISWARKKARWRPNCGEETAKKYRNPCALDFTCAGHWFCHWTLSGYSFLFLSWGWEALKGLGILKSSHFSIIKCPFSLFQTIAHLLGLGTSPHGLRFRSSRGKENPLCSLWLLLGPWEPTRKGIHHCYCFTIQKLA